MLIDSHAHVNFKQFEKDREATIKRALDNDIWMINVGSQLSTSKRAIEIAAEYEKGIYAAVGLHPIHLEDQIYEDVVDGEKIEFRTRAEDFNLEEYKKLANNEKVVAIGEIGFDFYHIEQKNKAEIIAKQAESLEKHLNLARELNLPVILHCREAYDELIDFLKHYKKPVTGVLHCYSGNMSQAEKFLEFGLFLGFTGIVTFKNAPEIQAVAKNVPLERVLVETDCPYLSPDPFRGKRNEPLYVQYVAKKIAELKNIDLTTVENAIWQNTKKLFRI